MLKIVDNFLECCSKTMLLYVKRLFPSAILFVTISLIAAPVIGQTSSHPLRALQESFREVSRTVKPAVVNVSTVKIVAESNFGGLDPFFENHPFREFFGDEIFRQFFGSPGGARRFRQQGLGSGFIVDPSGLIVTNRHVINGADEIQVTLEGNKKYKARIIYADPKTDIAIIKIDGSNFPVAKLGDSQTLEVGDWVLAIGNPLGLTQTVTAGIVSAKGRSLGISDVRDFIQTDAAINVGNSGGPLVNIDGQVVGMNTAIASGGSNGNIGIGFAIPSNVLKKVVSAALAKPPTAQHPLAKPHPQAAIPRNSGRPGPEQRIFQPPHRLGNGDI
ncbi:MAG: trypsin-like peptidase domain-containing protein [Desulfomonilaceae bacterium]